MFFHQIFFLLILLLLKTSDFEVFQLSIFFLKKKTGCRSSATFKEINHLLSCKLGKRTLILLFIYKNKEVGSLVSVKD